MPSTLGRRYFGPNGMLGLFVMLFWVGWTEPILAIAAFHWLLLWAFVHGLCRMLRPQRRHSHYNGLPWIGVITGLDEVFVKTTVEPCLLFVLGCLAAGTSESLAWWLIASAAGLVISNGYMHMRDASRLAEAEDAVIEQELFSDRMAAGRSGGRGAPRRFTLVRLLLIAAVAAACWSMWPTPQHPPAAPARREWRPR